jgi:hypothetical protein
VTRSLSVGQWQLLYLPEIIILPLWNQSEIDCTLMWRKEMEVDGSVSRECYGDVGRKLVPFYNNYTFSYPLSKTIRVFY